MVNYNQSKIYKIVNDDLGLTFYGSTCNLLSSRLYQHKKKGSQCKSSILFGDFQNPRIYLVENFNCNSKTELHARERWWVERNECINKLHL